MLRIISKIDSLTLKKSLFVRVIEIWKGDTSYFETELSPRNPEEVLMCKKITCSAPTKEEALKKMKIKIADMWRQGKYTELLKEYIEE